METFTKLFGSLLIFVYHCFDRVVIHGYLSGLSRPGQVVHFFQRVVGEPVVGKEVLSRRTNEYQGWVEAFARNHRIAIEWAEPKVRKEDYIRPTLRRMERAEKYGVYFILKSMEQGQTFRSTVPRFATDDPNYRILARRRSRFTHYYFYIRDETLGPMVMRVASFFPFQTTLLPQRPQLHRAGAQTGADRLPQDRQRLPRRRRRGGAAGRRRPAEPSHHPRPARLLDLDTGPEVLHQRTQAAESLTLLCHRPDRVLPQLHLQAQLSHPQTVRAQLRARLMALDCRQNH